MANSDSTLNIIQNEERKQKSEEDLSYEDEIVKPNLLAELFARLNKKHGKVVKAVINLVIIGLLWGYFGWATNYQLTVTGYSLDSTLCTGYGFLVIIYSFILFGICFSVTSRLGLFKVPNRYLWKPIKNFVKRLFNHRIVNIIFYGGLLVAFLVFLVIDTGDNRDRLIPLSGLSFFLLFGYIFSKYPRNIKWRPVFWGLILQISFGLLTIRWEVGRNIFGCAGDKVTTFLSYATNGSAFAYGNFLVYEEKVFAFQAVTTIYFLAFMINILYHYGLLQKFVISLGSFMSSIMGTTICESVNSAANIFLGMTEAPLLLAPFLKDLTDSEIHSIMASGFATVSGTVLAAYISFGANASHLITSSVMSAPAALCFSKLFFPEVQRTKATKKSISLNKSEFQSALDAASKGATQASQIVLGIIANVIAFVSLIYFFNGVLGWMAELVGYAAEEWSVNSIVGYVFMPISFLMGVPWDECYNVGKLVGLKTMVNEFVAFQEMQHMDLTPRSKVIATYAICGFSNPGAVGIMISGLSVLVPSKRDSITECAFRAFISGSIICFMTASIAGLLYPDDLI